MNVIFFFIKHRNLHFRERERQHQRDELWNRVENMAARSAGYDILRAQNVDLNNISNSPEQEDELTLELLEKETQEVCCLYLNKNDIGYKTGSLKQNKIIGFNNYN